MRRILDLLPKEKEPVERDDTLRSRIGPIMNLVFRKTEDGRRYYVMLPEERTG